MSEILLGILMAPLAFLIYGSGLLLWPLRRWRHRGQKVRGRALAVVFGTQAVAYLAVGCCSIFIRLGHFYYWFVFLLELNIVFTIAGIFAWRRDGRYERSLEQPRSA